MTKHDPEFDFDKTYTHQLKGFYVPWRGENAFIGISTAAPIYAALDGQEAGEKCTFNDRALNVSEIY